MLSNNLPIKCKSRYSIVAAIYLVPLQSAHAHRFAGRVCKYELKWESETGLSPNNYKWSCRLLGLKKYKQLLDSRSILLRTLKYLAKAKPSVNKGYWPHICVKLRIENCTYIKYFNNDKISKTKVFTVNTS